MTYDKEIYFRLEGEEETGTVISVVDGKIDTEAAEGYFYEFLRKNEKSIVEEAAEEEREEKSTLVDHLTAEQEDLLKEEHAKDYHGTDDDMPDAFEDWLMELSLGELKKILSYPKKHGTFGK